MVEKILADTLGTETAGRLVDGALVACLLAAVTACWLTGLQPVVVAALVAGSVGLERAVGRLTRRRILDTAAQTGRPADRPLRELVADVADRVDVSTPRVVVEASPEPGVTVLQGGDGPVLLLSERIVDDLDREALRGVVGHELAHLDGGHIDWLDSRDPVAHVVGAAVFWVVAGQHLGPALSLVGLAVYVGAGVFRRTPLPQLYYLAGSLGVVLLPLALIAMGRRLEERQADDRAVAIVGANAFCRGLLGVTTARNEASVADGTLAAPATGEGRGLVARVTATHPPLTRRFARYGVDFETLRDD
ncbi:M48 family metalloprotease [Halomicrobium sp. IBSBa]|uniref:M48 family metallopeptidase n=1 Tax=Halomicrobium sp. IBSBa TaxID=2778916 RepID=UPI001ABFA64C|nr:M48 family metalloprotease [Halomicrobium sp. IBSBa]MBO4247016.1 M48 family metalloprotease [Halomicrobium sp. IBSBa]